MELKRIKAYSLTNEFEFVFVNESKGTRNGFKHTTTLLIDNYKIISTSINYINRTSIHIRNIYKKPFIINTSKCSCIL